MGAYGSIGEERSISNPPLDKRKRKKFHQDRRICNLCWRSSVFFPFNLQITPIAAEASVPPLSIELGSASSLGCQTVGCLSVRESLEYGYRQFPLF